MGALSVILGRAGAKVVQLGRSGTVFVPGMARFSQNLNRSPTRHGQ